MKKTTLINSTLSATIARLGHTDTLAIGDAGLPIPEGPQRVDLALREGIPPFVRTVETVLEEMTVEKALINEESAEKSPETRAQLIAVLDKHGIPVESIPHSTLKSLLPQTRAVVRTGEYTPFCNVILVAGVAF
ncbi:MAG: D-ribose pyranase [Spirochaetales bacterium]